MNNEHHEHSHGHHHHEAPSSGPVLTIRAHSGLSGDIFLAGLLCMTGMDESELNRKLAAVMPELEGSVHLIRREVHHIGGMHAQVDLPHQHEHRTLADVLAIIAAGGMSEEGKALASRAFTILAEAEGAVHGKTPAEVHFHEVGALDSILDICMSCELFCILAPSRFVVSPLPMADGFVRCAHGVIPVPAPAVLELMDNVPVRPFPGQGETVTPTAMALLKALGAEFGPWPAMRVEKKALVYGTRVFDDAPNGALFACGRAESDPNVAF